MSGRSSKKNCFGVSLGKLSDEERDGEVAFTGQNEKAAAGGLEMRERYLGQRNNNTLRNEGRTEKRLEQWRVVTRKTVSRPLQVDIIMQK